MIVARVWVVSGPSQLSADLLFAALLTFLVLDVFAVRMATGDWRRIRSNRHIVEASH
jgi:hypothetical protein